MDCPACKTSACRIAMRRNAVPVLSNRLYDTAAQARLAPVGQLSICVCLHCGFVFNAAFDPSLIVYDESYENDQANSTIFTEHMAEMARRVHAIHQPAHSLAVVEIGCGQGRFLQLLVEQDARSPTTALGYDPAWRGQQPPPGTRIERRFFDAGAFDGSMPSPDIVVSRHVIEHIPDPVGFLTGLRETLRPGWPGRLCLETPCLEWIVEHAATHDFVYEHCNYFTEPGLRGIMIRAGWRVEKLEQVFSGQYFWLEATVATRGEPMAAANASQLLDSLMQMDGRTQEVWRCRLADLRNQGEIAVWGAGAKGINFLDVIDPTRTLVSCLIDINPRKQDRFTPLSARPVLAPQIAVAGTLRTVIVMNPNYRDEIAALLASLHWSGRLIDA
jgi:SAM-dependent methyltransferase